MPYSLKTMNNSIGLLYSFCKDNQNYLRLAAFVTFVVLMLSGLIQSLVINFFVFSYLSYKTLTLLKSNELQVTDCVIMLKYWTTFASLMLFEAVTGMFSFLPFYLIWSSLKLVGIALMMMHDKNMMTYYDVVIVTLFKYFEQYLTLCFTYLETKSTEFKSTLPEETKISYSSLFLNHVKSLVKPKDTKQKKQE